MVTAIFFKNRMIMKRMILTVFFCIGSIMSMLAQTKEPAWDNTSKRHWSPEFKIAEIPSSKDGAMQKAYIYKTTRKKPQPLIVSLHTWSGYYNQTDPLAKEILARDWNYIHPDFRGANRTFTAMCSPLALADIEDAIQYALQHTNVDPEDVHIVGVSGGGLATLAAYMYIKYPVKSFSAWAPISDIEAWYWESVGRGQKYANDIVQAVSADGKTFNPEEAVSRSPLWQAFPIERRKDARLFIYEGIHDGYKGSVPITHSLNMYNRLVGELKYNTSDMDEIMRKACDDTDLISPKEIIDLLGKRINPEYEKNETLFGRGVHLKRRYKNISLTIFEGRHEQIPQALGLIPYKKRTDLKCDILTIGDSNGANKDGWVTQLAEMMPKSDIVNLSEGGRTIGFDNNGRPRLNALKNIDSYLDKAQAQKHRYDYIIVCLGTNDYKKMFDARQGEIPENLKSLLTKIKKHAVYKKGRTKLIYVTPPPIRKDGISPKYEGSGERLARMIPELKAVASGLGCEVADIHNPLSGILDYYAKDGVHMPGSGQEIVASQIVNCILSHQ